MVAGGAGFLGSHLCDRLLKEGRKVIAVDDLSTGSLDNIDHLKSEPSFDLVEHDIRLPLNLPAGDVYNLACPASPPRYQEDPIRTMEINVVGTLNLLKLADAQGCQFLQASTSEVYGDPLIHPQPETYWGNVNAIGVRSCYDEGKRAAETLCFDFARRRGTDVKVVRIFNTYGPRMSPQDGRVVSNFVWQALQDLDITIYGQGGQTRSFCYVSDLIEGFWRTMNSNEAGPINLGNPREFTISQLADVVIDLTGSSSKIIHLPLPSDDPRQRQPDISRAKDLLGWEPQVGLREGLSDTIKHFREILSPKSEARSS